MPWDWSDDIPWCDPTVSSWLPCRWFPGSVAGRQRFPAIITGAESVLSNLPEVFSGTMTICVLLHWGNATAVGSGIESYSSQDSIDQICGDIASLSIHLEPHILGRQKKNSVARPIETAKWRHNRAFLQLAEQNQDSDGLP